MTDELLDIIDEQNNVIGQETKATVHAKGLRHRVSAILVRNQEGKYLIPTASDQKVEAGGLFHSSAGHVTAGTNYKEAAARELMEETALQAPVEQFTLIGSYWLEKEYPTRIEKERFEVFEVEYKENMGKVAFNAEQTNEQWLSSEKIKNIFVNQPERLSYPLLLTCQNIFKFA